MPATQPSIALNNGVELPALGFSISTNARPTQTQAAVEEAFRIGYRMVNTAAAYGNEREVGAAIAAYGNEREVGAAITAYGNEREVGAAIAASGLSRAEVFVQTKLWVSDYGYDDALRAFDVSTRKLGLDTIDLYMLHQPLPQDFEATAAAYRALERLLARGRARAIGVSNLSTEHLATFLRMVEVVPAINQVEVHPYYSQPELPVAHARHGIATQSGRPSVASSLCRGTEGARWRTRSSPGSPRRMAGRRPR